jgi:hypothetical protein
MMNTNLSPVSGFRWQSCHYTLNDLTGKIEVKGSLSNADNSEAAGTPNCDQTTAVLSDKAVRSMLEEANKQFQIAFAYFQHRRALRTGIAKY